MCSLRQQVTHFGTKKRIYGIGQEVGITIVYIPIGIKKIPLVGKCKIVGIFALNRD
ncbi:hypothetical protein GCM10007424_16430 [Flavobacterium suaedae]|uniref:Uncharacterized protein n=1 Tax=Flavobacterium suaedae TaxID=1767027 RepID=A0ABQ1JWX9_9FLAO|nr:hypothetical protein GCM10007424_16430 [Flavobacterium suaedae]